jgi:ATP-binding cassette subfamily B protein
VTGVGPRGDRPARRTLPRTVARAAREAPSLARGLALTVALAVVGALGALVVPLLLQRLVDGQLLAAGGVDPAAARRLGGLAAGAALVAGLASWRAMFRLVRTAATGLDELRVRAFDHLHRVPTLTLAAERRGALVARVTSDVETVADFVEWGGLAVLMGGSQLAVVAALMVALDPVLAAVVLATAAVYAVAVFGFQRLLAARYDRVRVRVAGSLAAVGEAISGLPTIRAHGTEARTVDRVGAALERQFRTESRARMLGAALFSSSELFAAAMTATLVVVGVRLGSVTAGQLVAFLLLVALFVAPIQILVEVLDQAQSAGAGLRRILDVLDTPLAPEPVDPLPLPPGPLALATHGLGYAYPDADAVLSDVTLTVRPGERVAVVGRTGSGKSTFVKAVVRLQDPPPGTVLLGGVPLERVARDELRRRVAFVPQEPFLLDASIADNVRYGAPDVDDATIRRAFDELGLAAWLDAQPEGLATRVGERGGWLSSGERQLVALARAWVAQPDLLVLDEATSAVDPALDVRLRRAVERLTAGRTSLTVAHRLATAEVADRVLVLDGGRLVEDGPHAELLARGGTYAGLHRSWTVDSAGA